MHSTRYVYYWTTSPLALIPLVTICIISGAIIGLCHWLTDFTNGWQAGVILSSPIFLTLFYRRGLEVDKIERRYRNFWRVAGLRLGSWEGFPSSSITRVVIKSFSDVDLRRRSHTTAIERDRHPRLVALLSVEGSQQGIVLGDFLFDYQDQAKQFAHELSDYLGVPWEVVIE